jgi:hypothetical protein
VYQVAGPLPFLLSFPLATSSFTLASTVLRFSAVRVTRSDDLRFPVHAQAPVFLWTVLAVPLAKVGRAQFLFQFIFLLLHRLEEEKISQGSQLGFAASRVVCVVEALHSNSLCLLQ